ncbi:hypothetical protein [Leptothoe sp. PORK10 BA2]|uniref:hypothetical protein n=1 Tax=Leptothoe sp. PORK10 BA2 TaxID=3110254 RepID=UPI002B1EB26E|nr:hypothetical protein [Leptothoe sp. PORK10 BA2]MEA5466285.1 hypothetical protein [Leptothoe sp. PORK10 BA2]
MNIRSWLLMLLFGLGLLVAFTPMVMATGGDFQSIDQSLGLRLGVTLVGLGLIGLELWWFLFNKK